MPALLEDAVKQAVDIAKAGIPANPVLLTNPDVVAKFIEVVAKKIHALTTTNIAPQ